MNIFKDIKESIVNKFQETFTNYATSKTWKEYLLGPTFAHCIICLKRHGKVYHKDDTNIHHLPEHEKCLCYITWLRSVSVGNATKLGVGGPDYYLKNFNKLPDYYITKQQAKDLGWKPILGNLDNVAPGKSIGGDIFYDRDNKLPKAPNRIWYECDIDYNGGYRNNFRLIYSNDGLMFKTDSHYNRFIAIE